MNRVSRTGLFALGMLVVLFILSLAADWTAPYSILQENREHAFHPPVKIRFVDAQGSFHLRPFVYPTQSHFDRFYRREFTEDISQPCYVRFFSGRLLSVDLPARLYFMGTDSRGRDIFSRIFYGARVSLSVSILGALLAAAIGLAVGMTAGYFGGATDHILMRISEFFVMIPGLYFLLALRSVLPPGLSSKDTYLMIVVILSFIGWGGMARVIRGMVLSLKENQYVEAAKVLGRNDFKILGDHILPFTGSYLFVVISMSVPGYILGESALSVLGLGIQEPDVSWGNLLTEALSVAHLSLHPWVLWPGIFIVVTSFCFHLMGDEFQKWNRIDEPVS